MSSIFKTSDKKALTYLNKSIIFGFEITEIKAACNNFCYLIKQGVGKYVLYIPEDVKIPRKLGSELEHKLEALRGDLQVIGGKGIVDAESLFANIRVKELDLSRMSLESCRTAVNMFYYAYVRNLIMGEKNTPYLNNTRGMFKYFNSDILFEDSVKIEIDLNSWDMSNVEIMIDMFFLANISELYIDNWNINKDCVITGAFNNIQVDTLNLKAFNLRELYKGYSFMSGSKIRQLFINEEDYKDSGVRKRVHESSTFMLIKF